MEPDEAQLLEDALTTMTARHDGHELTNALDAFGWLDLLRSAPEIAVPTLFAAQGRQGSWSSAFHDVLANHVDQLGGGLGAATVTVVVPPPRATAAGRVLTASGASVAVDGLCVGSRPYRRWLLVPTTDLDVGPALFRLAATDIRVTATRGLDDGLTIERIQGEVGAGATVLAGGEDALAWWTTAEALGRRALCHQICAAMGEMLELALVHARERAQFGQPIGTFQAVRHKLAEAYVALAAASAAATAAWDSADSALASATAKLVTSRAGKVTARHTQQVLAGIGFTAEHPYQHLMKRAIVLDRLLGSAADLAPIIGHRLAAAGSAPRLVEL
jgi:acyl-CoA dehydrogenase-like protein